MVSILLTLTGARSHPRRAGAAALCPKEGGIPAGGAIAGGARAIGVSGTGGGSVGTGTGSSDEKDTI